MAPPPLVGTRSTAGRSLKSIFSNTALMDASGGGGSPVPKAIIPARIATAAPTVKKVTTSAPCSILLTSDIVNPRRAFRTGEKFLGLGHVDGHLRGERFGRAEFRVLAHEGDEFDFDGLAVEVPIEIEEEDFEQRQARIEGRPGAEIGRASDRLAASIGANGINAVLQRNTIFEADIGGRETQALSAPCPALHHAGNAPIAPEQLGGPGDVALGE